MATRDRYALTHGIQEGVDAAQHEIERAKAIADELRDVSSESSARAGELRSRRRDK